MNHGRLPAFDFDVFVFEGGPAFDEESVGIVVGAAGIAEPAFCDEVAGDEAGGADDLLGGPASEMEGIGLHVEVDAVDGDLLADITGDDAGIVAVLFQVVIETFGRAVCQVEGAGDIARDHFLVGVEGEKIVEEAADMVAGFYGYILFAVGGECFERFAGREDIDPALRLCHHTEGLPGDKAGGGEAADDHQDAEEADMLEGGFQVLCFGKHGYSF